LTSRGKGAEPLVPRTPYPSAYGARNYQKEVINRNKKWTLWAALLAATGQLSWPSAGAFHGRHWARLTDR